MTEKIQKAIRLSNDEWGEIGRIIEENNLSGSAQAISFLLKERKQKSLEDKKFNEVLSKLNSISKENDIQSELIGEYFYIQDINSVAIGKTSLGYQSAVRRFEKQIEKAQVKKFDRR